MAKDKQEQSKASKGRSEGAMMRALYRKATRVAKSCGRPALESFVAANTGLKVYFAKDIARLVATTWTPKPKAMVSAAKTCWM